MGLHSVWAELSSHAAFFTISIAHLNDLSWTQFGEAEASQSFHMTEDIRCSLAARQEAESTHAVKPLAYGALPIAFRLHDNMRALRQLAWMDRRRFVHRQNAEGLQAFRTFHRLTVDACTLICGLVSACAKAGHMEQNIA